MPNKFQHISDYLGLNIGSTPDNIGDLELSDCNNVDLSMPGTVSVLNGRRIVGNDITGTSYDIYKSYLFKKFPILSNCNTDFETTFPFFLAFSL